MRRNVIAGLCALLSLAGACQGDIAEPPRLATRLVPKYVLAVEVMPGQHRMRVAGSIQIPEVRDGPLKLLLHSMFKNVKFSEGGFAIAPVVSPQGDDIAYRIEPLAGHSHHVPRIDFQYEGGESTALVFSLGEEASFASGFNTNWYPELQPGGKAVGTLTVNAPSRLTVIAAGTRAASASNTFTVSRPSYFWFAAGKYTEIGRPRAAGVPSLSAFLLHARPNVVADLATWDAILSCYRDKFGAFPFESFSVIEVPASQANAAQFQGVSLEGAVLVQSGYLDDFSVPYFAHEIAHQWWGVSVAHTGPTGRYLFTESMAQWAAERFVERTAGPDAAATFRRWGFGGGGEAYFDLLASGGDHRLLDLPTSSDWLTLAWTKGMFMLDALERVVRPAKFQSALVRFQQEHTYGEATWPEFWNLIEASAPRSAVEEFSRIWLEGTDAPEFTVSWKQDHRVLRGTLRATGPHVVPLTVSLRARDRIGHSLSRQLTVTQAAADFSLTPGFDVADVVVDPDYRQLRWTTEFRERSSTRAPYIRAERLRALGKYSEGIEILNTALRTVPQPDKYAATFLYEYELGRMAVEQQRYAEAAQHATAALAAPTRDDELLPWLYFGLAQMAKGQGNELGLKQYVAAAISADASAGGHTGATEAAGKLLQ